MQCPTCNQKFGNRQEAYWCSLCKKWVKKDGKELIIPTKLYSK